MRHIAGAVRSHILIGIATVVLIGLHIPSAAAQPNGRQAGVVTKLRGSATVAHAASAMPVNLRFKDPVFLGDTVNVRENSVARLLLGDRALVTLRELSIFRLTEEVDRAVIDLNIGKLSLAVLRKKMGAGELIEVRTPNAIAAVRGTVLIAEFDPGAARSGDSQSGEPKTTFSLLEGTVTVSCGALSIGTMPQSRGAGGDTVVINQYEQVTVTGSNCGPVTRFPATDAAKLLAGLQAPLEVDTSSTDATSRIAQVELDKALALASYLAPGPVAPRPPTGVQPPAGGPPAESGKEPSSGIGSTSGGGSPETSPPTASSSLSAPSAPPADQAGLVAAPEIGVPKPEVCRKPSSRPSLDAQPSLGDRTQNADTTGCDVTDQQLVAASEPILQGEAGPSTNTSSVFLPTQGLHFPIVSTTQQTAGLLPGGSGGGTGPGSGGGSGGGNSGGTPITAIPVVINGGTTTLGPTQTISSFPGNQTNPGSNPLVQINNGTVNQNPSGSIVQVPPGSTVTTGGPALVVTNSTINAPGSTLVDVKGTLKSTGSPLIDLQNSNTNIGTILDVGPKAQVMAPGTILNQNGGTTTINQGGILVHDNSQLMGGQLITNNNGAITVNNGPLVGANNSSSITTTSMSPAIQLNGGSLTLGPDGSGLSLTNNSTATLGGPAIGVTNGTITGPNNTLISVQQSTLTSNKGPLVDLTETNTNIGTILNVGPNGQVTAVGPILNQNGGTTTINQGGILVHDNSQLTGSQLVNTTNASLVVNGGPLAGATNNGTITTTSTNPAIQMGGGSLTLGPGSSGLLITDHSTATLTGPIVGTNGTTVTTNGGHLVNVSGNSSLTLLSTTPAIQMTGGSLTLGPGSSALSVTDHSTVNVGGPVFQALGTTLRANGSHAPLINISGGSSLTAGGRLLDIRNTSLSMPGQPVVRVADGSRLTTTAGPAFCVIDGSLTADSLLQSIGTPANPINIRGPLFHLERGSAQLGQLLDNDSQRGSTTITLGTGEPVVTMKDSTLTLTKDGAPLVALGGAIPRTQTGVSLIADNSTISTKGPVLELQNLSYTDSNPQLQLTNSKTTVTGTSSIVEVKSGTSSIAGLLLKASGGTITAMNLRSPHHDDGEDDDKDDDRDGKGHHGKPISAGGGLLEVKPGAVLEHKATTSLIMTDRTNLKLDQGLIKIDRGELATKATQSLVMINEGTHSIATASGSAMFELHGTNVDNHGLGTDQPLHGGKPGTPAALAASLLEATGATITTESAVKVDRALLSATQPLLELKSNTRVTANTSALTLTRGGQILETGDYLVGLDCSRFTVRNGSFLSLVGDNLVKVQGDLLVLRNGSIVTLEAPKNGFLISASGASVVEILGSLVRFGGTGGNVLRVANELKPTKVINGIPVRLSGGATTSQVVIEGTPIENPTLGKITNLEGGTFKGSLINVEGTQAKVIIRGR